MTSVHQIKGVFSRYDRVGDGQIPKEILSQIVQSCVGRLISDEELQTLLQAFSQEKAEKLKVNDLLDWAFSSPLGDRGFKQRIEMWTTDEELKNFGSSIPLGLQDLFLHFDTPDQFSDDGMSYLGAGLPLSLTKLSLVFPFSWTECRVTSVGLGKVFTGLSSGIDDLELAFMNDEFNDEVLFKLAEHLPQKLKKLRLMFRDNADFTDLGLKALLAKMPSTLRSVYLNFDLNSSFTDAGLAAFADWLTTTGSAVEELDFINNRNSNYTDEAFVKLCAALPTGLRALKLAFSSSRSAGIMEEYFKKRSDQPVQLHVKG
jgi:hypothetical protein